MQELSVKFKFNVESSIHPAVRPVAVDRMIVDFSGCTMCFSTFKGLTITHSPFTLHTTKLYH